MNNKDVIIIGAGLTGLSMAYFLRKSGMNVTVLEKESRAGGVINTISENGFTFEAGPSTGVLSSPELASLFSEISHRCTLEIANSGAKKRYILKNGKWQALPSGPVSAVTTPLFTLKDKFRILGEPFRKPGNNPDETLADMVRRRMGKSFLDYAVDPFISGVYAGDPELLVTRFALPKLYALEQNYGSFIKGAIKKAKEPKTDAMKKATGDVFSTKNGLSALINALVEEAGKESILTGLNEIKVLPAAEGYSVTFLRGNKKEELTAKKVITTFGGPGIREVLPFLGNDDISTIADMKYAGVVQAAAGFRKWKGAPLDAFGGLIPSKEGRGTLGILFPSAIFGGRAPETGAMLSIFLGGAKKPGVVKMSDNEIKKIVMKEISDTLHESSNPDLFRIFRYVRAIPQYEKSSGERLESIKKIQEQYAGLILAGNIRDGIGMSDRVKQARHIADQLAVK
jgi:oxygen-dependent protoporphyrinogen oxidase